MAFEEFVDSNGVEWWISGPANQTEGRVSPSSGKIYVPEPAVLQAASAPGVQERIRVYATAHKSEVGIRVTASPDSNVWVWLALAALVLFGGGRRAR